MDAKIRIAAAAVVTVVAMGYVASTAGTALTLGVFLTLVVLAYAYGPVVANGVAE